MIEGFNNLLATSLEKQMQREQCPTINLKQTRLTDSPFNECQLLKDLEWPSAEMYLSLGFEEADKLQICGVSVKMDKFQFITTNEWMTELKSVKGLKDNLIPEGSRIRSIQICSENVEEMGLKLLGIRLKDGMGVSLLQAGIFPNDTSGKYNN